MNQYLADLGAIWSYLLNLLGQIFNLYTTSAIFISVFTLWVLDRIFGIFDILRR